MKQIENQMSVDAHPLRDIDDTMDCPNPECKGGYVYELDGDGEGGGVKCDVCGGKTWVAIRRSV